MENLTPRPASDQPAPDALGMSASLRSRPNLCTAAIRRGVPGRDLSRCGIADGRTNPRLRVRQPFIVDTLAVSRLADDHAQIEAFTLGFAALTEQVYM